YWYSNYLSWVERDYVHSKNEALDAIELEPLISHSYNTLASVYVCFEEFEEACKASQTAIELDPNAFLSYTSLAGGLYGVGKYEEAINAVQFAVGISARHQYVLLILSWLYAAVD